MGSTSSTPTKPHPPSTVYEAVPAQLPIVLPHGVSKDTRNIPLNSSYRTLYAGILSLVQDNKYADLVIICGTDQYPVHRAIVCPRSRFFAECCEVRDGEVDHASPGKPTKIWIDPSECESHVLAAVLTFLYTLDYAASGSQALVFGLPQEEQTEDVEREDDETRRSVSKFDFLGDGEDYSTRDDELTEDAATEIPTPPPTSDTECERETPDPGEAANELVFHAQVYLAAQQFRIAALGEIAREKFNKRLRSGPWGIEMSGCIREVYRHTHDPTIGALRDDLIKSTRARFRVLKTGEGWNDLVLDFPEFAAELLKQL